MRRRSEGQSLVEMALMLPLLLLVLFGIIDLGYYIYNYATIYESARNGTEKAAELPPLQSKLNDPNDVCVKAIRDAVREHAVLFGDVDIGNAVLISYPDNIRALSKPIQVEITYNVPPLTPLFRFVSFGNQGVMTVHVQARRSIESLGDNPNYANDIACQ